MDVFTVITSIIVLEVGDYFIHYLDCGTFVNKQEIGLQQLVSMCVKTQGTYIHPLYNTKDCELTPNNKTLIIRGQSQHPNPHNWWPIRMSTLL